MQELQSSSDQLARYNNATSAFGPEFGLLLACCHVGDAQRRSCLIGLELQKTLDWAKVLDLAHHHGVLPMLHRGLAGAGSNVDRVPRIIREQLHVGFERNIKKNLWQTAELFRILDCLDSARIAAIPHKGPVLAEVVYGDLALRDFSDLDILIRRPDVSRAKDQLARIGYIPTFATSPAEERAYLVSGYEHAFLGSEAKNLLEIQWDILPRFYAIDFSLEQMFERASTAPVSGRVVRALCQEDLLLALSIHAAKHLWIRLCWLRDLAGLMQFSSLDWKRVVEEACRLGVRRMFAVGIELAHRLLGASLPAELTDLLCRDAKIQSISDEIAMLIPAAEVNDTESLSYFLSIMRLRERASDRVRFLTRLAVTPGMGEWSIVKLPAPLFPIYHVIRGFRLIARMAGMRRVAKKAY